MDPVVAHHVTKDKLLKLVSRNLVPFCEGLTVPEPYAVAVFRKEPVRLGMIKRAFRKFGTVENESLLIVGQDFTAEALAYAEAQGAHVVARSHFGWTEQRYEDIHTSIATGKKRPVK